MLKRVIIIFLLLIPIVYADYEISYQGRVTNIDGSELGAEGNLTVEINASTTNNIFSESYINGIHKIGDTWGYDVILGRILPLSIIYNDEYIMCAYVNGELQGNCYNFKSGVGFVTTPDYGVLNLTFTSETYTGNVTYGSLTGYKAVNAICNATLINSHMCNEFEIVEYTENVATLDFAVGDAWVISPSPKYVPADHPVDSCKGFTSNGTASTDSLGNYWKYNNASGGRAACVNCATLLPLSCCR